jgi:hypothetical protein
MTDAMAASRTHFVEPSMPDRVRWLPLKFKKRGQPIPFAAAGSFLANNGNTNSGFTGRANA